MQRLILNFAVVFMLLCLCSCETIVYWQDLPKPSSPRVTWIKGDNASITRAVKLAKMLVDVKPLSATVVFVMTNEYRFSREKLARIRPTTLGQAGRIPGVSPNDLQNLLREILNARVSRETLPAGEI